MELADALGFHHVVVDVAHRLDGVGVVGGPGGKTLHVSREDNTLS